jgi:hypothetical protein
MKHNINIFKFHIIEINPVILLKYVNQELQILYRKRLNAPDDSTILVQSIL